MVNGTVAIGVPAFTWSNDIIVGAGAPGEMSEPWARNGDEANVSSENKTSAAPRRDPENICIRSLRGTLASKAHLCWQD